MERSAFTFDAQDNSYLCPGGKRLRPRNRNFSQPRAGVDQDGFIRYRARQQDCRGCALQQNCTPNMPARKIMRSVHEAARDKARTIALTDAYVAVSPTAKEGRNAVRPPQANPQTRPVAPAGSKWRQRRVPPRSHRPEPAQNRKIIPMPMHLAPA
jgi:hypothetical protein